MQTKESRQRDNSPNSQTPSHHPVQNITTIFMNIIVNLQEGFFSFSSIFSMFYSRNLQIRKSTYLTNILQLKNYEKN